MAQKHVIPRDQVLQAIQRRTQPPFKQWVSATELAQMLYVSDRTARRYLSALAGEGKVERVQVVRFSGGVRFVYRPMNFSPSRGGSV